MILSLDSVSLAVGVVAGLALAFLCVSAADFVRVRRLGKRTCEVCKLPYRTNLSTSKYRFMFCSLNCEYGATLENMMRFSGSMETAKMIVDKDPRFAKFSGKSGTC